MKGLHNNFKEMQHSPLDWVKQHILMEFNALFAISMNDLLKTLQRQKELLRC